jgi:hypothetical protein
MYRIYYKDQINLHKKDFCEKCGCVDKPLIVHHKDKNFRNNQVENLLTLCRSCHQGIHVSMYPIKPYKRGRQRNSEKEGLLRQAIEDYNNLYK